MAQVIHFKPQACIYVAKALQKVLQIDLSCKKWTIFRIYLNESSEINNHVMHNALSHFMNPNPQNSLNYLDSVSKMKNLIPESITIHFPPSCPSTLGNNILFDPFCFCLTCSSNKISEVIEKEDDSSSKIVKIFIHSSSTLNLH